MNSIIGMATAASATAAIDIWTVAGTPSPKALIDIYGLKDGSKILDVGCGKAFLLYEIKQLLPGLQLVGFDMSRTRPCRREARGRDNLFLYRAQDAYPFGDKSFRPGDLAGDLHNLRLFELKTALAEDRTRRQAGIHHA